MGTEKGKEKKERGTGLAKHWAQEGMENSKGFPFSNLFTKIKLIWIQFKFKFRTSLVTK
jgi:hypothetical protein